jgi:hypothetical protein
MIVCASNAFNSIDKNLRFKRIPSCMCFVLCMSLSLLECFDHTSNIVLGGYLGFNIINLIRVKYIQLLNV